VEEQVDVLPLSDVITEMVDMLTLVMVGSSETRVIDGDNGRRQVYTPRGYGDKKS
jgi:cobalt-precorrin 5A hydrolase/precorrin-3B C17-methyltransferase